MGTDALDASGTKPLPAQASTCGRITADDPSETYG